MPDPQGLDVHDMVMSNQPQFTRTGGVRQVTVVTYYVGDHGPFTLTYNQGDDNAERITSDIQHQVAEMRRIMQMQTPG
jgi:hypothetical protein